MWFSVRGKGMKEYQRDFKLLAKIGAVCLIGALLAFVIWFNT